jgi:hypothetical protein
VIAVHTASAPDVSMVVAPPAEQPDNSATVESCSVTIDGEPVSCTVTRMASDSLSVALVIDTASGLTSQELAAAQSGATEFLLRLPDGARTMVVTAAGQPEVVAPLSGRRAEALSAISALRVGGTRATMPAAMLAAQSLESAPPGPRAIIVYTHGIDEQGVLTTRLSQAVLRSEAVLNVIRTDTDPLWPSVVDQAGGSVVTTTAENIAQSFGDLAATLGEQYLVTFEAPGKLPAVAQVAFQTGDQEYKTVVNLPDSEPAQAAPTESSEGSSGLGVPWLVALLVAGLGLTMLGVFLRRARQPQPVDGGEPSTEVASPATGAPPPDTAAAATGPLPQPADKAAPNAPAASLSDDPTPNGPPQPPSTSPAQPRPARKSLTAAVEGRRLARLTLDSQPESRPEPAEQRGQANNNHAQDPPTDPQAPYPAEGRNTASGSGAGTKSGKRRPENPAEGGQNPQPESR